MPNDSQAKADLNEEPLVDDPLDASNDPENGATELANYESEVAEIDMELDGQADAAGESDDVDSQSDDAEEDEAGDGEEQDSEDEEGEEEEQSADDAPDDGEEEETEEEDEPASKSDRFRIRAKDEVETEALALRKRHPDWSLKECIAKAESLLGVEQSTTDEGQDAEETLTVASLSEQIAQLRAKRDEASASLEFETSGEIQREIDALQDQREELRFNEVAEKNAGKQREAERYEEEYSASEAKAVKFYPDTTNPKSELVQRMAELDSRMRDNGDPLYHSTDKPFILAKAAAKELGIIMSDPGAKPAKALSSQSKKSRPVQPVSGSARTTATNAPSRTKDAIEGIEDLSDYESLVEKLAS